MNKRSDIEKLVFLEIKYFLIYFNRYFIKFILKFVSYIYVFIFYVYGSDKILNKFKIEGFKMMFN